ncbi:PIN domain-containing protein [Pendulispora brunnea]|uniref:PIN domain-containing protein n=1 Tax=Pendulispora brunnea TaxID=2905690 RepID=A0ABZ2KCW2_9BACT
MLDTNILSAMRFDPSLVSAGEVATTSFNLSEILYGALRRPDLADVQSFARFVIENIPILDFNGEAAAWYAKKRIQMNFVKPNIDAMIAAITFVHDATLVTRNVRDFPFDELNVVTRC